MKYLPPLFNKVTFRKDDLISFEIEDFIEVTPERAKHFQAQSGFNPDEYGFANFSVRRDTVLLRYLATWECRNIWVNKDTVCKPT